MGLSSNRTIYIAIIWVVIAAVAIFGYSLLTNPPQEITGIIWNRSGGFAGFDETLTIRSNGSASLSSNFLGQIKFSFTEEEWNELITLIKNSGFMELDDTYGAKTGVADFFSYSLIVEMDSSSKQVLWVDDWAAKGNLPDVLNELGEKILGIIEGTGVGSVTGTVSDYRGNPIQGYLVSILRGSNSFPEIAVVTGKDGYYEIDSIPPGIFTIGVTDENGKLVAEKTIFVKGGKTSILDFLIRGEILYDHSGGVGLFDEGIHIIATTEDPTISDIIDSYELWNDYWVMLRDASTLVPKTEDFVSILISRGDLPTGGFQIEIESFAWQESYPVVFKFDVNLVDPGEGVVVTEAFTNPIALIPLDQLDPGIYIARAHIDRFIVTYDDTGNPIYDHVETLIEEVWETEFEVS